MVLRHCRTRLVHGFHFEYRSEWLGFGSEQISLHIAVGNPGAGGDAPGKDRRLATQRLVLDGAIYKAQRGGCDAVDDVAEKVELPCLGRAYQACQTPRAAKIT